ncbi:MAG: AbrB/MazE/SpoVT family DNA-binding domain-containing protein [Longimicrobiales bacterium]
MAAATLTSKGQITIPKTIRDRLGLEPGDRIDFVLEGEGQVVLRPRTRDFRALEGILYRPGRKPVSVEQMRAGLQKRFRRST